MYVLLVVAAVAVVVALYFAGIVLVGRCLNLHGRPPVRQSDRREGEI